MVTALIERYMTVEEEARIVRRVDFKYQLFPEKKGALAIEVKRSSDDCCGEINTKKGVKVVNGGRRRRGTEGTTNHKFEESNGSRCFCC